MPKLNNTMHYYNYINRIALTGKRSSDWRSVTPAASGDLLFVGALNL